ncbi:NRDE-2, necessary for RNA interference [Teratosphaeria destructans]|uniref:NRDE-2, necessary for RNA interference n=1 Tax=Teratosphaeria destructans TaxID=418781 RepID=A0A9W7SKM0_9PEZI|nr:NRDE-2, necessary for RNA interference [Teratosphaeria destructans]
MADDIEESDLFIIDRRGDPKNLEFGRPHRYSVPAYHRFGHGRLLGAARSVRLDRDQDTGQFAVLSSVTDRDLVRVSRPLYSKQPATRERKLRLVAPVTQELLQSDSDFVALHPGLKQKRRSASPQHGHICDYRSIESKARGPPSTLDSDLASGSDSDGRVDEDAVDLQTRQESAVLSKQIKHAPKDVETWLRLITHQAKVLCPHGGNPTFGQKRTIADLRLAIYDQALQCITVGEPGHERLLLGMLDEGAVVWEASKLAKKWTEVLTRCPTSFSLWTKYLDFIQADHVNFSYETCKGAYLRCLQILRNARDFGQKSTEVGLVQVRVIMRFAAFTRDAGYDELANSIWQTLLEMTFFKPADLADNSAVLKSLEEFWDADVPRIGEECAPGWARYAEGNIASPLRKTISQEASSVVAGQSIQRFVDQEVKFERGMHLPAALDNDDEFSEDPYRQVMFTDVGPFIEPLLDGLPTEAVVNAFLIFMGLPQIPYGGSNCLAREWQLDPYLAALDQINQKALCAGVIELTTLSLFDDAFDAFKQRSSSQSIDRNELASFVDRILGALIDVQPSDDCLAEYYLAYKLAVSPVEARKLAKRLLKGRPSSLRLYNAYALVEASLDRMPKAREVWEIAINRSGQLSDSSEDHAVLLWHSWVFSLIRAKDEREALHTLLAMLDNHLDSEVKGDASASAVQRLKASRFFEEMWERSLYTEKVHHAFLYAECHIWFVYLTNQGMIAPAMDIFEKYAIRAEQSRQRLGVELIYQAQARLLRAHLQHHRAYKPAALRLALTKGLQIFPNNGLLIDTYAKIGSCSRIEDRLRSSLWHGEVGSESSLVAWSHFLSEEVRRCNEEASGSTANSVRSSFTRALLSPDSRVKHSVALWTLWLQFESSWLLSASSAQVKKNAALAKARQVFLDGLRMLPWSKSWIIEGLRLFSREGGMSEGELRQVYHVLAERELRVRVNVGEVEFGLSKSA